MNYPIIRLELDQMKENIHSVLISRSDEFNTFISEALDKALTVENLKVRIEEQVNKAVNEAIGDLSKNYIIREIIREIVSSSLNKHLERMNEI